jgi:hypothetical protein
MRCKKLICQECATTFEGINHCAPCLTDVGGGTRESSGILAGLFVAGVAFLLLWAGSYVTMWVAMLFLEASS